MTGNYNAYTRGGGVDVEFNEIVDDVDEYIADSDELGQRQPSRPGLGVVVASHRDQRRHEIELIENPSAADIAPMHDVVAAHEKCARLRPQKPMGIGDESNAQVVDLTLPVSALMMPMRTPLFPMVG